MSQNLAEIVQRFQIPGEYVSGGPYGTGHINDTYAVTVRQGADEKRFILQRVNHRIFKDVPKLMENICRVTEHLRAKVAGRPGGRPERDALTVIPAVDNRSYHQTAGGDYWRAYVFIEGARTYDVIEDNRQAYEAGKAFGAFQGLLADLPPPPLHETIRDFHHTPKRFETFEKAVADDVRGRRRECGPEIEFVLGMKAIADTITRELGSRELPLRVTHNDTKINNVMLDNATGAAVCVIDLDTVMPGSILYDFGDQVRTTAGNFKENEKDLSQVYVDVERFGSLARGYLETAGSFLTKRETDLLVFSGMLITLEIGVRFLTDYLQGDVYFKIHRPEENLDRCRTQFEFVRSIRKNEKAMQDIVERHRRGR